MDRITDALGALAIHRTHGSGQVVAIEYLPDWQGNRQPTGRVGVIFDQHTLTARPAYFWPQELQLVAQDNRTTATHTGSHP